MNILKEVYTDLVLL